VVPLMEQVAPFPPHAIQVVAPVAKPKLGRHVKIVMVVPLMEQVAIPLVVVPPQDEQAAVPFIA